MSNSRLATARGDIRKRQYIRGDQEDLDNTLKDRPPKQRHNGQPEEIQEEPEFGFSMDDFMTALRVGESITITRLSYDEWKLAKKEVLTKQAESGRIPTEFWQYVCTQEYLDWQEEWATLNYEEKIERAEKLGATWEHHENSRNNMINMALAIQEVLGIEKFKERFRNRAVLNRAMTRAKAGFPFEEQE